MTTGMNYYPLELTNSIQLIVLLEIIIHNYCECYYYSIIIMIICFVFACLFVWITCSISITSRFK